MANDVREFLIEGRCVSKFFKDFWGRPKVRAVTDVDIQVPKGSVFGLLGPNGAGKSTLIKMILGHLYPTSGRITVFGKHPTDVESKSKLGYLPERAFLYKHLTPMQTLRFFGEVLELPGDVIRARSEQLLDMVGLKHAKDRIVGEFSHGMGRRMGLAQALLNDPDLLLLDEPTAGLDPLGCREVKNLILNLAERGKTVVLTSHLLADVEEVSDRLMIMYGGRVQAVGDSRELLAKKDVLQITMPAPDDSGRIELEQLATTVSDGLATFSSPIRSLENYFLEIVQTASETQETQGAQAGAGVASYLKADHEVKPKRISEPVRQAAPEPASAGVLVADEAEQPVLPPEPEPVAAEPLAKAPVPPAIDEAATPPPSKVEQAPESEPESKTEPVLESYVPRAAQTPVVVEPTETVDEEDIDFDLLDRLTK